MQYNLGKKQTLKRSVWSFLIFSGSPPSSFRNSEISKTILEEILWKFEGRSKFGTKEIRKSILKTVHSENFIPMKKAGNKRHEISFEMIEDYERFGIGSDNKEYQNLREGL